MEQNYRFVTSTCYRAGGAQSVCVKGVAWGGAVGRAVWVRRVPTVCSPQNVCVGVSMCVCVTHDPKSWPGPRTTESKRSCQGKGCDICPWTRPRTERLGGGGPSRSFAHYLVAGGMWVGSQRPLPLLCSSRVPSGPLARMDTLTTYKCVGWSGGPPLGPPLGPPYPADPCSFAPRRPET